jgi:hypothetical protein
MRVEVSLNFEVAVYISWGVVVVLFLLVIRLLPTQWHTLDPISLEHPGRETLWALAAAAVLVGISVATDNFLGAWKRHPSFGRLVFFGQLLLVYSPVIALLVWRKHGLKMCFLRFDRLPFKILLGTLLALTASFVFLLIRGRSGDYPEFLATLGHGGIVAMLQTFMEGFAVGFLLYRFGAWIGIGWSSVVVAVLFMAAHIQNYTSGTFNLSLPVALLMAAAHAGIGVLIFVGVWRSQDIIVFGMLHWFINRASDFSAV